ncbi:MAG TPA: hypothetical protein VML56_02560 [Burkholderiales bacterium]|nr:hypothetical protein [Burkholderiales bacterium]
MPLEQVFYLSQSIASIAVVGSLIYLGLQVRGADRSQRAIMQQGRADRASKASLTVAKGELARVWQRGMDVDPTMTREEVTQWLLLCRSMFLSGEDSFLQHKAGTLDQAAFDSYCAGVRSYGISSRMEAVGSAVWQRISCVRRRAGRGGADRLPRGYTCRVAETRTSGKSRS